MRISTRQAKKLRPIAIERARQSKLPIGEQVFYGGICYGMVQLYWVHDHKPYKIGTLMGKHTAFSGPLTHCYRTREEYEASGVHWL